MTNSEFLAKAKQAAMNVGLSWPGYIAAECALESRYGNSILAVKGQNLLGMKAHHSTPPDQMLALPTKEFINGQWISTVANWMRYPDWEACLRDRQATLVRMAPVKDAQGNLKYSYQAALDAPDGETFVRQVSRSWSTDPHRADKVLEIYSENQDVLG